MLLFNPGAIGLDGKILLVVRAEGNDRKSFFAVAESENGVDHFKFWDYPITMPETKDPDTNGPVNMITVLNICRWLRMLMPRCGRLSGISSTAASIGASTNRANQ